MVHESRLAFEQVERQLSEDAQRLLAAQIEAWLDEQELDALVGGQRGQETLARLAAEAREEIARGEVEDEGFGR